jgi:hypothetical protein
MVLCSFCRQVALPSVMLTIMFMLAGCSSLPRISYSASDAVSSTVLDLDQLRRYADEPASSFLKTNVSSRVGAVSYLALSGGGADGAYGAGVLNGWTAAGTRPEFSVVSGVSTGALIAPFAFLGPAYDGTLRDVYTSGVAESLLNTPNIVHAVFGSGLFGNTHLRELVARYIGKDMLGAIAAEDGQGSTASHRHDQSRYTTYGNLGYGPYRCDQVHPGVEFVQGCHGRIGKYPGNFPADADRCGS